MPAVYSMHLRCSWSEEKKRGNHGSQGRVKSPTANSVWLSFSSDSSCNTRVGAPFSYVHGRTKSRSKGVIPREIFADPEMHFTPLLGISVTSTNRRGINLNEEEGSKEFISKWKTDVDLFPNKTLMPVDMHILKLHYVVMKTADSVSL